MSILRRSAYFNGTKFYADTGGAAGDGLSGFSYGGDGDGKGAGGNAYSGAVSNSQGGDVVSASDFGVDNTAASKFMV